MPLQPLRTTVKRLTAKTHPSPRLTRATLPIRLPAGYAVQPPSERTTMGRGPRSFSRLILLTSLPVSWMGPRLPVEISRALDGVMMFSTEADAMTLDGTQM